MKKVGKCTYLQFLTLVMLSFLLPDVHIYPLLELCRVKSVADACYPVSSTFVKLIEVGKVVQDLRVFLRKFLYPV